MAALRAGEELARIVGDAATLASCSTAFTAAQSAVTDLLWDQEASYFRAYSYGGDSALMADSLYGVMIAQGLGLGPLVEDPSQLTSHLRSELERNYDPFGFVSITGRVTPPPGGQHPDDSKLWQQAGPDWSTVALNLGASGPTPGNLSATLDPAFRQLDNWRTRLRSLWNLAGLTSNSHSSGGNNNNSNTEEDLAGLAYCTAHYGFALTSYWLLPALSSQKINLPQGTLSFNTPAFSCPFKLPVLSAALTGTLSCDDTGLFTLKVVFGTLNLPNGGLSAMGKVFNGVVNLGPGDSVTW